MPPIGSLHDFNVERARWIAERDCRPEALPDAESWLEQRPRIYQQFLDSLGLSQLPAKCDLKAAAMGTFSGEGYTATKLAYQLLPDCWGSAHFYRPAGIPNDQLTPAVLYTCGHHLSGVIGYQEHAIAWARRGYSCLIFDTIQQHDNTGDHHALNLGTAPDWLARGFTAAGGEVWNGIRALDLLLEQPGVDAERVGVTGISGGGSQSFLLALVDDRLKAAATACGVSSPDFAIAGRHMLSHCDCIYIRNVHAREISTFAALAAPRALLYCFARHDSLFSPEEFRTLYQRSKARFDKLGCGDKVALQEYDGPHGYNVRETTDAIHDWFDQHVAGEPHPPVDTLAIKANGETLTEPVLSVYNGVTPEPNYLDQLPRLLPLRGQVRLPADATDWGRTRTEVAERLRQEVFPLLEDVRDPLVVKRISDWVGGGVSREAWHAELDGMAQFILQLSWCESSATPVIVAMGEREQAALPMLGSVWESVADCRASVVGIEGRAAGARAFRDEYRNQFNREGALVGQTPTMLMVQDLHYLMPVVKALPSVHGRPLYLYGKGEGAIAMLCYALLNPDPDIKGIILEDLPASMLDTPYQVMRLLPVLDIPQAVALLAPTPVAMINRAGTNHCWYFVNRVNDRLGSRAMITHHLSAVARDWFSGD